ncbi:quinolinate synthase NadA, partial [Bacillus haynesii]|nr:quinolinate synthase NadA [Bacillus haynesii]
MSILNLIHDRNAGMMPELYKELTEEEMAGRILKIKKKFGERLFIPGHHYQK